MVKYYTFRLIGNNGQAHKTIMEYPSDITKEEVYKDYLQWKQQHQINSFGWYESDEKGNIIT